MRVDSRGSVLARLHKSDPELTAVDQVYNDIEAARWPSGVKTPAEIENQRSEALYHGLARASRLGARLKEQFVSPIDKEYIKQEFSYLRERLLSLAAPDNDGNVLRLSINGDVSNYAKSATQAVYDFEKVLDGAFRGALKRLDLTPQGIVAVAPGNITSSAEKIYYSVLDMVDALPRLAEETTTGRSHGLDPSAWVEKAIETVGNAIVRGGSTALATQSVGLTEIGLFLLN